jgi:hypothetical protein
VQDAENRGPRPVPPIARLYRSFDPVQPLQPDDERYVNLDDVRAAGVKVYARDLRRADPEQPDVKLFAGHQGVGKTSELYRLRELLQVDEEGLGRFFVIYADAAKTLDLNDLDFPDLLVFLAAEIQKQLGEAKIPGLSKTSQLLKDRWDGFKRLIGSKFQLTGADVDVPFGTVAVEIKNQPSSRQLLREAIESQSTQILFAVNDLLKLARQQLQGSGYLGLVLIVDGLDKVTRRELDSGVTSHERLFINRREQLASLDSHVIYTIPISLCYSPLFAQLEQVFGEHHVPVPMIRLHPFEDHGAEQAGLGMAKMREITEARCRHAGLDCDAVFDDLETLNYLCKMSGGHPRHLLMFIRSASSVLDDLPITRAAAEQAVQQYANSLSRQIPDEYWPKLRVFDRPQRGIPKDDDHQRMLFVLYIFEYMNREPWHEVNPVIRLLPQYTG